MTDLEIVIDDRFYRSNDIEHGVLAKKFFDKVARKVFEKSFNYWSAYQDFGVSESPLLHSEKNIYSIFSCALGDITPIHSSEWPLSKDKNDESSKRIVDFWCANQESLNGKLLNYFMELKKFDYCISSGTCEEMTVCSESLINDLIGQIREIKKIDPKWEGDGNVYIGFAIIPGYYSNSREAEYGPKTIVESIESLIDGKIGAQLIAATWMFPDDMDVQWDNHRCGFVTIAAIVISKKNI